MKAPVSPFICLFLPLLALFAGCAVGPGYQTPEVDTELGFTPRTGTVDLASVSWWKQFEDPVLTWLITDTLEHNLQLEAARHRWAKSLAMLDQAEGARSVKVDLETSLMRQERSENGMFPVMEGMPGFPGRTETLAHGGLQLAWEADLFGRTDAQVEVAEQGTLMSALGVQDGWRLVLSETGRNYLLFRTYAAQVVFLDQQITSASELLAMDDRRLSLGVVPKAKVDAHRVLLKRLQSRLPALKHQQEGALIRLSVLTTLDLETLRNRMQALSSLDADESNEILRRRDTLGNVSIDTDHLLSRPDLRIARARLDQSIARHKLAVSNLYPRIVLVGGLGLESIDSGELLTAASRFWSLGPALSLPVFHGGQLRAQVEVELEEVKTRVVEFRAAYLNAIAEVQTALHQYLMSQESASAHGELLNALQQQYATVKIQNQAGVVSHSEVLQAEMELISAQIEGIEKQAATHLSLINLCQAVGGSWGEV